jgi:hypothetical protein
LAKVSGLYTTASFQIPRAGRKKMTGTLGSKLPNGPAKIAGKEVPKHQKLDL